MNMNSSSAMEQQRKRKQQEVLIASEAPLAPCRLNFRLEAIVREYHDPSIIYSIVFCDIAEAYNSYFATAGSNCLSLYRVVRSSSSGKEEDVIQLCKSFVSEDSEEVYYASCFGLTDDCKPCLFSAGERGVITGHCLVDNSIKVVLAGHGNSVNDLRIHPRDRNLLLSASKDQSARLWNVQSHVCIAIFAGLNSHKDEVLCVDFHAAGNVFVSSGQDTSIRLWSLETPQIKDAIGKSYSDPRRGGKSNFLTWTQQSPIYTCRCHGRDYIDTVRFVGNLVLSKSTKNRIVLWCPDGRDKGAYTILREFMINDQDLFFVRLAVCPLLDIFAYGNKFGKVSIFQLSEENPGKPPSLVKPSEGFPVGNRSGASTKKGLKKGMVYERYQDDIHHEQVSLASAGLVGKRNVRAVSFSSDGAHVVYTLDDGSIYLWSISKQLLPPLCG